MRKLKDYLEVAKKKKKTEKLMVSLYFPNLNPHFPVVLRHFDRQIAHFSMCKSSAHKKCSHQLVRLALFADPTSML